jgi:triosephosphate isomerase
VTQLNQAIKDPGTLFVGVSTKMYLGYGDSLRWLDELRQQVDTRPALAAGRVVPFVIPSFPMLPAAGEIIAGSPLVLGAQNCGWADGAWTGELSPSLLAELGVGLVEIGHAERRRHFGEDDAMIALKVRAADDAGVTPLLCVGEESRGTEIIPSTGSIRRRQYCGRGRRRPVRLRTDRDGGRRRLGARRTARHRL